MSLDDTFTNFATARMALLALLVVIASSKVLEHFNPENEIRKNVGNRYVSIGMTFGYKPDDLYTMLDGFTEKNTKDERFFLILDLIYPLLYGFSGAILLAYLQRIYPPDTPVRFHYLWVLPLCAMVCDWGENISMILIQSNYTKRTSALAEVSSNVRWLTEFSRIMTMLKLLFIYASLFMIVCLGLLLLKLGWKAMWHWIRPQAAS